MTVDPMEIVRKAAPMDGEPVLMMPAEAYTSPEVLAWERRHLFAGSWTCLGRVDDLFPEGDRPVRQRAVTVGDIRRLLMRDGETVRMFANTCRHRGHELLPDGGTSDRRKLPAPTTAGPTTSRVGWSVPPASATSSTSTSPTTAWSSCPCGSGRAGSSGTRCTRWGRRRRRRSRSTSVPSTPCWRRTRRERSPSRDRHTYEVAANWKVISENYHECYHCPLIHPELCQVSPPTSGDNYDLPGGWIGGSMDLRDGMRTMSLTGELAATPLPGAPPTTVEYVHLLPNLLVSAHPDYVMTHRMVPLTPDRTWVECSWLVLPGADGSVPDAAGAVEFWDITNKQDWAACESVQRGLASPHFRPGPFAPKRGRGRPAGVDDRPGLPHRSAGPAHGG